MSLVNIVMTRDRAFIASDTQVTFAGSEMVVGRILGGAIRSPKILPLPHARCVLAYRSNTPAIDSVLTALLQDFESFDRGLTLVPELAQSAAEGTAREFGFSSLDLAPHELRNLQLFLVGWSESQGCMGMLMTWFEGAKQRTMRIFGDAAPLTHCLSCPGPVKAMPSSAQEMAELARAWVAEARATKANGALGVGGTLVVTEITSDTIAQTYCGELGFHPDAEVRHLRDEAEPVMLQVATVPKVETGGIAVGAVAPIATAVQSGSTNVYLTDATIASTTIDSQGYPILVSFTVDCDGSYSGDKATFSVKVNGSTSYTKDITGTRDSSQPGAPWSVKGATVQTVIASPGTGTKTIAVTAIGTHATYGVTVNNGNLYCEGKLR